MSTAKKLKLYLVENDISQTELSKKTGIAIKKINRSLNGKRNFTIDEFELILSALNETADKFISPRKALFERG